MSRFFSGIFGFSKKAKDTSVQSNRVETLSPPLHEYGRFLENENVEGRNFHNPQSRSEPRPSSFTKTDVTEVIEKDEKCNIVSEVVSVSTEQSILSSEQSLSSGEDKSTMKKSKKKKKTLSKSSVSSGDDIPVNFGDFIKILNRGVHLKAINSTGKCIEVVLILKANTIEMGIIKRSDLKIRAIPFISLSLIASVEMDIPAHIMNYFEPEVIDRCFYFVMNSVTAKGGNFSFLAPSKRER
jgi:hypothetical protein